MIVRIRPAVVAIVALLAIVGCYAQESPEDYLKSGNKAMAAEDVDDAIFQYTDGIAAIDDASANPSTAMDLEIALGDAYSTKGNETAKKYYENAINIHKEAKRSAREKLNPKKAEALFKFADAVRLEERQTAVDYYMEAGKLVNGYWQAWVRIGRICEDIFDEKRGAIEGYKDSVQNIVDTHSELLDMQKEAKNPEFADLIKEQEAEYRQMIKEQEKEIKQMIKDSFIYNERAMKFLVKGYNVLLTEKKEEIVDYPEDIEKTSSKIMLAIGRCAVKTGQKNCAEVVGGAEEKVYCKALAVESYKKALEHDPTNKEAKEFYDVMFDDEAKNIVRTDYVQKMLKDFEGKRKASHEAGRDEL